MANAQGRLAVRGDALGVLQDVLKSKAKDRVLNCLAHEMALITAPLGTDLRAAHVWSEQNQICDQLSRRLSEGSHEHPLLKASKVMKARRLKLSMTLSARTVVVKTHPPSKAEHGYIYLYIYIYIYTKCLLRNSIACVNSGWQAG